MKIQTNKDGKLFMDDVEKEFKDLTAEILEEIVTKSLNNEIELILDNEVLPIAKFLKKIQAETSEGSELKTRLSQLETSITEREEKIEAISEIYEQE